MATIICVECGVKPCKRGAKKYCSYECSHKHTSVHLSKKHYSIPLGTVPWNKGVSVHLSPDSEFKKGNKINVGRKRWDIGEKNKCWKGRVTKTCIFCAKDFLLAPWQVRQGKKFCTPKCYQTWHRGVNSPVYKGEKSARRLRNRIADMPEYREWHAFVLKRDGYRCVKCNCKHSKKTPLEVDHIKRFLHIANEYKILTLEDARKCKELWDTKNGQTVCKPCHRTLLTYGTTGLRKNLLA